jgi:FemAB-related protein (PEP-CTERM system-associated)
VTLLEGEEARWDAFVAAQPDGTFCHLSGWRRVMKDVLGHDSFYCIATGAEGAWEGVLPLVRVRGGVFGDYLLSMPFLNYGGALGTPSAREVLGKHAAELAARMGVGLLELRTRTPSVDTLTENTRKVTVLLPLPSTPEALWGGFSSKLRSQIRRPQKAGMQVRFGADQLDAFYRVYARNMRDLGTPVLTRRFFDALPAHFADELIVCAVYAGDEPVAAGAGFLWQGEFEITWASSVREFNRDAPNMLLYWSLMEHMIARGATVFNFGRCTPDGGTHRFKLQWGGETVPLPWRQWSPSGVSSTPNSERGLFNTATRVWSRLPLPLANWIGPLVARHLP